VNGNSRSFVFLLFAYAGSWSFFCDNNVCAKDIPERNSLQWWQGEWTGEGACPAEKYSIQLKPENDSVRFEMKAYSGAHTGGIEGLARWETNRLVFTSMNEDSDPPAPMRVTFHQAGEKIRVFTTNTETFGGMGIEFHDRWYDRGTPKPKKHPLAALGLLTPQEDEHLKKISGKDYETIVYSMHLTRIHNEKYPDFQGKVADGFVRGMAYERGAMVLVDHEGRIAAAVTEPESREVRFYSQLPGEGIPRPIRDWRSKSVEKSFVWVIK